MPYVALVGAMACINAFSVLRTEKSVDLKLSELEANATLTEYYYANGTILVRSDGFNTNWKKTPVVVDCSFQNETYGVKLIKCGYGDGDCYISDLCIIQFN